MRAFGHGENSELDPAVALQMGTDSVPVTPQAEVNARFAGQFQLGDSVAVMPVDYGRFPVAGTLLRWTAHEIAIQRQGEQAGEIVVHFPNTGFEVVAA